MFAVQKVSKDLVFGGVKIKVSGKDYGQGCKYFTVSKTQLRKILLQGKGLKYKCNGRYTDDYAFDNAYNFGITDYIDIPVSTLKRLLVDGEQFSSREHGMGLVYCATVGWYSGLYSVSYLADTNEMNFYAGQNESFTIKEAA
jgi:hypothetical protein